MFQAILGPQILRPTVYHLGSQDCEYRDGRWPRCYIARQLTWHIFHLGHMVMAMRFST